MSITGRIEKISIFVLCLYPSLDPCPTTEARSKELKNSTAVALDMIYLKSTLLATTLILSLIALIRKSQISVAVPHTVPIIC